MEREEIIAVDMSEKEWQIICAVRKIERGWVDISIENSEPVRVEIIELIQPEL